MAGKIRNNRGQIASTITWFVAFIIIFFIMTLFIIGTVAFSAKKRTVSGADTITLENSHIDLKSQEVLLSLLNSKINFSDKETAIKEILRNTDLSSLDNGRKSELREKIKLRIQELNGYTFNESCFIFIVVNDKNIVKISTFSNDVSISSYVSSLESKKLSNSASIILVLESSSIPVYVKYYQGGCV